MSRFAIAGIQMKVSAINSNVEMMKLKLDITMNLYPWVQMVVFSELCGYGPLLHTAQEFPGEFEAEMQAMAVKYGIWLLPGSVFERRGEEIFNNQCYMFDVNGLDTGGSGRSLVCGPDGRVLYQAQNNEEIIPIELDLENVRRSREYGVLRLGQPLKSFRDHMGDFSIYWPNAERPYLDSLGPLIKPGRMDTLAELKQRETALMQAQSEQHIYKGIK